MTSRSRIFAAVVFLLAPHLAAAQWQYARVPDRGSDLMLRVASVESRAWTGTLMVRMLPDGGVNVAFGVPATIACPEPCRIRARLDRDDKEREARYPGTQRNMLFFSPRDLPFEKLRASTRLDIEVPTTEHGWRVLTFDVSGLELSRLIDGR